MMFLLPPPPPVEGLHPLIVHFPIALLLVAPVLVVLGLSTKRCTIAWWGAAAVILILGTLGAWAATMSGEASEKAGLVAAAMAAQPDVSKVIDDTLETHSSLAESARNIFTAITALFSLFVIFALVSKREMSRVAAVVIALIFVALWSLGAIKIAQAGHLGATLVHKYHVTVPVEVLPSK